MDRMTRMLIRAYLPALIALGVAFALLGIVSASEGHRVFATWIPTLRWLPLAAFVFSFGYAIWITHRLWRRERGDASQVCACGGLLGREHGSGAGAYRKCLACGRRVTRAAPMALDPVQLAMPSKPLQEG